MTSVQETGEPPDPRADDPEEVVHGAEEIAADEEEAGHVHVEKESEEGMTSLFRLVVGRFQFLMNRIPFLLSK